jgi:hypothetical protein
MKHFIILLLLAFFAVHFLTDDPPGSEHKSPCVGTVCFGGTIDTIKGFFGMDNRSSSTTMGSNKQAAPSYFKDERCESDCRHERAGYTFAEEQSLSTISGCAGKPKAFVHGCGMYLRDHR